MKTDLSQKLFEKANTLFPGGVNSPVRAFKGVGGTPRFIARGRGSHMIDVDGNDYVDYVLSWGPLIAGHCHPEVMRQVQEALKEGSSFGAPCPREIVLGEQALTMALQRLSRQQDRAVLFLEGHGERKPLGAANYDPVSYTHLTLPTSDLV